MNLTAITGKCEILKFQLSKESRIGHRYKNDPVFNIGLVDWSGAGLMYNVNLQYKFARVESRFSGFCVKIALCIENRGTCF